ncbi:MAG: bifunctional metallophosphatase/5'-nucleotidase [Paludibacteraceae bacterium]|nr:bifunctional metallophosphatase/5'-nucleotidase [Paludibacteraceae bacterium]
MIKIASKRRAVAILTAFFVSVYACVYAEHLTIVGINDTHSMVLPDIDNLGGVLRQRAILDSVRAADKNVIAVHAGDNVQGTPFFSYFKGDVEYPTLDSLGYDYIIPGNHEFDNGTDELYKYYSKLKCKKLNANYKFKNKRFHRIFKPYDIVEIGGRKIAFIGVSVNLKGSVDKGKYDGVKYIDATKTAVCLAKKLKNSGKADYVIMVSHIGYMPSNGNNTSDTMIVHRSHYIDAVIGGHSHTIIKPNNQSVDIPSIIPDKTGKNVIVTQTGRYGKYMTILDLNLENGAIEHKLIPVDSRLDSATAKYVAMRQWIDGYKTKVDSAMKRIIAYNPTPLDNGKVNEAGNWVTDVMFDICKSLTAERVDCFIINGKGLRHPIPKGGISEGFIKSLMPFESNIMIIRLKGKDLLKAFQVMASRGGDCVSSGVYVEYDSNAKLTKALINGNPINPDETYNIGTIDFMYSGGDNYTSLSKGKPIFMDNVNYCDRFIEYLSSHNNGTYKISADTELRFVKKD